MKKLVIALFIAGLAFGASAATAQQMRTLHDDAWCERGGKGSRYDDAERYCEVREITLATNRNVVAVDGKTNGGIAVKGWSRGEILVRAKVVGRARSEERARRLAEQARIETGGRTIYADVPEGRDKEWVSVSFEVFVPHRSNLSLETHNGGISIEEVEGTVEFDALNGGVSLVGLGGDVRGHTTNGGLEIELTGTEWNGAGMDVETTNGGVRIRVPENYSARLESRTVNGHIEIGFPVTVQGRIGRRISTELGRGGETIRAVTTNGGVEIRRG